MTMLDSYVYEVALERTQGRTALLTAEGFPAVELSAPPEFLGQPGKWTPEHLLAAAAASCFLMTFVALAEARQLSVQEIKLRAFARLENVPGEGFRFTEITLAPEFRLDAADVAKALQVIEKAERNCFVSKSLRATVQVEPHFVTAAEPVAA